MKLIHKIKHYYKVAYQMGHYPLLSTVLFSNKKVFVYYGFLGDHNYGDELVYEATKALFKMHTLLPFRRHMPIGLRLFLKYKKNNIAGIVVGGGTLIGPFWEPRFFEILLKMGKKVYVHGTGVHSHIDAQKLWTMLLKDVHGGVRGPLSVMHLTALKKEIHITGDAAFALFSKQEFKDRGDKRNVLINLGTHSPYTGQEFFRKEFDDFIRFLLEQQYNVCYLPFHEVDLELGRALKKTFPEIILLKQPEGYEEGANIFTEYAFALGERLHFTVMAIMTRTPFISINYAKKHEDLLLSLSAPQAGLLPAEASNEKMKHAFMNRTEFKWEDICCKMKAFRDFQFKEADEFIRNN